MATRPYEPNSNRPTSSAGLVASAAVDGSVDGVEGSSAALGGVGDDDEASALAMDGRRAAPRANDHPSHGNALPVAFKASAERVP
jgi:hypothetical protein